MISKGIPGHKGPGMKIYDAVVIGAGPAGITAALFILAVPGVPCLASEQTPAADFFHGSPGKGIPGYPAGIKDRKSWPIFLPTTSKDAPSNEGLAAKFVR